MTRSALVAVGAVIIAATSTASTEALFLSDQSSNTVAVTAHSDLFDEQVFAPGLHLALAKAEQNVEALATDKADESQEETAEIEEVVEVTHTVKSGESLSKIAKKYEITWQRIFFKNTDIQNPNHLEVDQKLIIPDEDEELKERKIPVEQPVTTSAPIQSSRVASTPVTYTAQPVVRGSAAGNTYYAGYCTWYAKSRRPDLPNSLGNADTWTYRAAAQGIPTGSTPRVGAIAQAKQGMHVAYVEAVHGNGTITVSEMNFVGWNVTSRRTASASSFSYIY